MDGRVSYRIGQRVRVGRWVRGARQGRPVFVQEVWLITRLGGGTVTASPPGIPEAKHVFDAATGVGTVGGVRIRILQAHE